MNNSRNQEPSFGISLGDIYFVVFRHKWKILTLTLLGVLAGVIYFIGKQPPFQSEAELFVRYITEERERQPDDQTSKVTSVVDPARSAINAEMALLQTFDLAAAVATNVGPEKILAKYGGGKDPIAAAFILQRNLKLETELGSSIIRIIFHHPDPNMVQPVLHEFIRDYLDLHFKTHSTLGVPDGLLTERITQLRLQIAETDEQLRIAKTNAGILDVEEAKKAYSDDLSRIRRELFQAESDLAGHEAEFVTKPTPTNSPPPAEVPLAQISKYKAAVSRLSYLQKKEDEYLFRMGYTEENKLVKEVRAGMAEAAKIKAEMEDKYPPLAVMVFAMADPAQPLVTGNSAPVNYSPQRVRTLQLQLERIQNDAAKLSEAEARIDDLQRKKKVQEQTYNYFVDSQNEANIKESIGSSRSTNIREIQSPTPPYKEYGKFYKNISAMMVGGLIVGLAWAFLIEFYFDRSIKRPGEIESKLRIPFFLSIPDIAQENGRNRLTGGEHKQLAMGTAAKTAGAGDLVPAANLELNSAVVNHALDSHYDALRDRLVLYFESINLTRKPKLVAVTSTDRGAGVSTIASGLAASLSETGDGRVLLVDMNQENGAAQQFFNGKPNCKLDDALIREKREDAMVQDRLYVVSEGSQGDKLSRVLPKRFATLVPQLKASDYDYIIFDMPPVSQTSVTTRLAGFMDTVMLVIESEKSGRESVQQAHALLSQSKANVTAVLNKTKQYVPARLQNDINRQA
jgi:uncharacterized protein involved in exopolysaccharide biosynthesis/Mrp family chromosome partitioning ATPase